MSPSILTPSSTFIGTRAKSPSLIRFENPKAKLTLLEDDEESDRDSTSSPSKSRLRPAAQAYIPSTKALEAVLARTPSPDSKRRSSPLSPTAATFFPALFVSSPSTVKQVALPTSPVVNVAETVRGSPALVIKGNTGELLIEVEQSSTPLSSQPLGDCLTQDEFGCSVSGDTTPESPYSIRLESPLYLSSVVGDKSILYNDLDEVPWLFPLPSPVEKFKALSLEPLKERELISMDIMDAIDESVAKSPPTDRHSAIGSPSVDQEVMSQSTPAGGLNAFGLWLPNTPTMIPIQRSSAIPEQGDLIEVDAASRRTPAPALYSSSPWEPVPVSEPKAHPFGSKLFGPPAIDSPFSEYLSLPSPRASCPVALRTTQNLLQDSLLNSWIAYDRHAVVAQTVDRRYQLSWGGHTGQGGDLDLVIRDKLIPQGYHPGLWRSTLGLEDVRRSRRKHVAIPIDDSLPPVYSMSRLRKIISNFAVIQSVKAIHFASTPILKFKHCVLNVDCDINVNDLGGLYNSSLILQYCKSSPYVLRPMLHGLKLWAAACHLNDPSGTRGPATMSSYCLTLMAIAYLQYRKVLHHLQASAKDTGFTEEGAEDVIWVGWGRAKGIAAHVHFDKVDIDDPRKGSAKLTAAEALKGFLSFYSSTPISSNAERFDAHHSVVSILNGGIIRRAVPFGGERKVLGVSNEGDCGRGVRGIQPDQWQARELVVQDPFLWSKNCAASISKSGLDRFWSAIKCANDLMTVKGGTMSIEDLVTQIPTEEAYKRLATIRREQARLRDCGMK